MTEPYTIIRRFLFELVGTISLDRNDKFIICFASFVLLKTYLKLLDVRGATFQSEKG